MRRRASSPDGFMTQSATTTPGTPKVCRVVYGDLSALHVGRLTAQVGNAAEYPRRAGATPFRSLRSVRLPKLQQEDIDRFRRAMRVGITGILGNAQEIAVVDQFEPGRLDLRLHQGFV